MDVDSAICGKMEIVRRRVIEGEPVKTIEFIPEVRDHGFAKVFQTLSRKVLQDLRGQLNGATDVLWYFIDRLIESQTLDDNPAIYAHIDDIARATGGQKSSIYKHLSLLIEHQYLIKLRRHVYQVNPDFVFIGRARPRLEAQLEFGVLTNSTELGNKVVVPSGLKVIKKTDEKKVVSRRSAGKKTAHKKGKGGPG